MVFVSALEGEGRIAVMHQVVDTYEKWCSRLTTARLNRWLVKVHFFFSCSLADHMRDVLSNLDLQVMSRHSWKDQAAQPKIKYFTQVKARPPTFVAFVSSKKRLSDTDLRFLTRSLKEDFDLGGIPVRIMQRSVVRNAESKKIISQDQPSSRKTKMTSDKRKQVANADGISA